MKKTISTLLTFSFLAAPAFAEHHNPEKKDQPTVCLEDPAVSLFNGENLDGWSGDPKFWSVKDGTKALRVFARRVGDFFSFTVVRLFFGDRGSGFVYGLS